MPPTTYLNNPNNITDNGLDPRAKMGSTYNNTIELRNTLVNKLQQIRSKYPGFFRDCGNDVVCRPWELPMPGASVAMGMTEAAVA